MELFRHLMPSTRLDYKDMEGREKDLNVSGSPIIPSLVAHPQLTFSKCELIDKL
jgi:hypothetical protein